MNLPRLAACTLLLWLNGHPTFAADCGASLATGLDISGSVSHDELLMQVDGIGAALRSPVVVQAFQTQTCVRIAVYVWGENRFDLLLPWTEVSSAEDAENAAANLRKAADAYQVPAGQLTNIAGALQFAWQLLGQIPPTGRQITNIVTNGVQNTAGDEMQVSIAMRQAGITINAVAFGPSAELESYLRKNVTSGFVLRAGGADDFPAIVRSKFILDVSMVTP